MSIDKYGYVHFWGFIRTVIHILLSITEMGLWIVWVYISWLLYPFCTGKCDVLWIKITWNLKTCWKNLGSTFIRINAAVSNWVYESWHERFQILYNVELNINKNFLMKLYIWQNKHNVPFFCLKVWYFPFLFLCDTLK